MLPIFFLAFAFIYQLSTTSGVSKLQYRPAIDGLKIVLPWFDMIRHPLDETRMSSMQQLENEAKSMIGKPGSRMNEYLKRAMALNKCITGLTPAECRVVTMYTDDSSHKAFYNEYNTASTNQIWQPYKVYTTLLMSALGKLSKIDPIPKNAILYRGISFRPEKPKAGILYWPTFSSATLDVKTAKRFAGPNGMILKFQPQASHYAAQVRKLSTYPNEKEVILTPFTAFDVLKVDDPGFNLNFKASNYQALLDPNPQCGIFDWKCLKKDN